MKLLEIIKNWDGSLSSRRFAGFALIILAIIGKILLFCLGLKMVIPEFVNLDNQCNDFLYIGSSLVGITTFDLFALRKNNVSNNYTSAPI